MLYTAVITNNGRKISYKRLMNYVAKFKSIFKCRSLVIIIATNTLGNLIDKDVNCENVISYISNYRINYIWIADIWLREKVKEYDEGLKNALYKYSFGKNI